MSSNPSIRGHNNWKISYSQFEKNKSILTVGKIKVKCALIYDI